ncbi:ATP synthase F1 subunit gamma [Candidatus Peregrinibacteria bacterium CG11_big_fil_rev_8_21_14_0_20_46_8]|nr:MAG: ATP synthase F1 subunit gamma [Candidatus Peregrinibacteria bacterium CG11_big_fil_rev_8_21_14_0_20_46_8]
MSGSLLEIRKKIGSVQNTRKITKAMQLVAASKMRQFQKRALSSRQYVWDLLEILENNLNSQSTSLFTEEREMGKTLFILYTSDKGLCGPLNTKIINGLFRSKEWGAVPESERLLLTIGKKGHDFAKNRGIPVAKHFIGIPEKLSFFDSLKVIESILHYWEVEKVKEVFVVAPHYKNSFTFYPVMKSFLPFTQKTIESAVGHLEEHERPKRKKRPNDFMYFEPDKGLALEHLYRQMVQVLFIEAFLELKASEYSSRMIAMQSATDAATRITNDLTRDYNKARQQAITNEIAELMGASAAL